MVLFPLLLVFSAPVFAVALPPPSIDRFTPTEQSISCSINPHGCRQPSHVKPSFAPPSLSARQAAPTNYPLRHPNHYNGSRGDRDRYRPPNKPAYLNSRPQRYVQSYAYGCYTEPSDGKQRALTGASYVNRDSMTVDECEYFCTGSGHRLWGVEYTGECYCGNSLSPGSFPTFPDECNIPCPGNSNETCGGLRRLSLYGTDGIAPKGVASSHPQVYRYTELGCITEGNRVRAFSGASLASEKYMTVERCGHYCINSGFTFFGLEYGSECYCGHGPARSSKKAYQKECNMDCSGKKGEICGGMNRLSAYHWV